MDQLETKIRTTVQESELDAVLAFGPDNFSYLTRTVLPFAEHYPNRGALSPRGERGRVGGVEI